MQRLQSGNTGLMVTSQRHAAAQQPLLWTGGVSWQQHGLQVCSSPPGLALPQRPSPRGGVKRPCAAVWPQGPQASLAVPPRLQRGRSVATASSTGRCWTGWPRPCPSLGRRAHLLLQGNARRNSWVPDSSGLLRGSPPAGMAGSPGWSHTQKMYMQRTGSLPPEADTSRAAQLQRTHALEWCLPATWLHIACHSAPNQCDSADSMLIGSPLPVSSPS